ncbi:hypothetical protein Pan181_53520 [Aeoliella mucimassa]|uniref:Uncharacterized protein n=1 Tax=Aeoliella mucimassa TaxID=2527972 RepID=A0A518AWN8_9BACT|nr:hypothetical protein Pan181_53520 [Aeoliella mucimassa]
MNLKVSPEGEGSNPIGWIIDSHGWESILSWMLGVGSWEFERAVGWVQELPATQPHQRIATRAAANASAIGIAVRDRSYSALAWCMALLIFMFTRLHLSILQQRTTDHKQRTTHQLSIRTPQVAISQRKLVRIQAPNSPSAGGQYKDAGRAIRPGEGSLRSRRANGNKPFPGTSVPGHALPPIGSRRSLAAQFFEVATPHTKHPAHCWRLGNVTDHHRAVATAMRSTNAVRDKPAVAPKKNG